jgi:aerobic carbon-monoxide dehydrogenase large subunit
VTGGIWATGSEVSKASEAGKARLRKEDARLVTGHTNWTDNIQLPGMVQVAFLRSPMAHARIMSVDLTAAREAPGVIAAFSGADFGAEQGSLPCAWPVTPDILIPAHPPMAIDEVRYVGEIVAGVVARDRYAAADALELIDVDYEPLPPVLDMEAALAEGSPKVHEAGNKCFEWVFANCDMDAAFRDAPVALERTYRQQRLIPSAMEPRAVVCAPVGDEFTLWSATQIPHVLRVMLAVILGIPEQKLRVVAPDVGGGFGSKRQVSAEEVLTLLIARKTGRPVKWTESRSEGNLAVHHGRDQIQRIKIAADRDGRLRGLSVDLLADMGAYLMLVTPGVPLLGAFMYNAIYKMDAYSFKCTGVFTTKTPTDAYSGAGQLEATFAIEHAMDDLAAELGMDPLELRRRNWITHSEFPYTTIAGLTYDSGNYEAATAQAVELFGYDELRREQAARRSSGDPVQLGIGISTYTKMYGPAPSRVLGQLAYEAGSWEYVSVRMLPTGKVEVVAGSSAHGQGHETAWSQIVAGQLGVPFEDVRVLHGDTAVAPKDMDTYGSRSLAVGGIALYDACQKVIGKAKVIAAGLLEVSPDDLEWTPGRWSVRGDPDKGKTVGEIALATFAAHNLPEGVEPSLDSDATLDPETFFFPHGTHLCAVEVDTETGQVQIRSYVAVDDVGVVVNPLIVEGQLHGGIAQGIAQALYEEAIYDTDGNLLTTTLADYLVPSAADLPTFTLDRTETPATTNPLGVKGVGEAGAIASTPAVMNAVIDALRPLGINDIIMPCTPERIWRALEAARSAALASLPRKGVASASRRAIPGTLVSDIPGEVVAELLPQGLPPTVGIHPSIWRYANTLSEPYGRALLWVAAVEIGLVNWPVPRDVPHSAATSFGFGWQEDNKRSLAVMFGWPDWVGPPRQIGEVHVPDSDVNVPVFATRLTRHPQALPHPPRGLCTCLFRTDQMAERLFLTAAHVLECANPGDELRPGMEVRLEGYSEAERGRLIDIDPYVMDAALVSVSLHDAAELAPLEVAEFVAPGEPVVVAVRGGLAPTRVIHVSGPMGLVDAVPGEKPRLQSIVYLQHAFRDGDSGALVMRQTPRAGVSMYLGAQRDWELKPWGYGVLLRQPLVVFDLMTRAEVEVDGRNVTA